VAREDQPASALGPPDLGDALLDHLAVEIVLGLVDQQWRSILIQQHAEEHPRLLTGRGKREVDVEALTGAVLEDGLVAEGDQRKVEDLLCIHPGRHLGDRLAAEADEHAGRLGTARGSRSAIASN
jgi:hypothetical protein